jgi:hypothetical protein
MNNVTMGEGPPSQRLFEGSFSCFHQETRLVFADITHVGFVVAVIDRKIMTNVPSTSKAKEAMDTEESQQIGDQEEPSFEQICEVSILENRAISGYAAITCFSPSSFPLYRTSQSR